MAEQCHVVEVQAAGVWALQQVESAVGCMDGSLGGKAVGVGDLVYCFLH